MIGCTHNAIPIFVFIFYVPMKQLTCKDVGVDCDVIFTAETDEEVMQRAAEHAAMEHNLPQIPPVLQQKCLAAIKDIDG